MKINIIVLITVLFFPIFLFGQSSNELEIKDIQLLSSKDYDEEKDELAGTLKITKFIFKDSFYDCSFSFIGTNCGTKVSSVSLKKSNNAILLLPSFSGGMMSAKCNKEYSCRIYGIEKNDNYKLDIQLKEKEKEIIEPKIDFDFKLELLVQEDIINEKVANGLPLSEDDNKNILKIQEYKMYLLSKRKEVEAHEGMTDEAKEEMYKILDLLINGK